MHYLNMCITEGKGTYVFEFSQRNCNANYAYGKSGVQHAVEGLFTDAAVTRWRRGEAAPVIFVSFAHHWGSKSNLFMTIDVSNQSDLQVDMLTGCVRYPQEGFLNQQSMKSASAMGTWTLPETLSGSTPLKANPAALIPTTGGSSR